MTTENTARCCPPFEPAPWHEKELAWKDMLFVRATMPQFLHTPLPGSFQKAVARAWRQIEAAGAKTPEKDFLMLAAETSPWQGEVFINAAKPVPGAENVRLSGTFYTMVFDGPYNAVPRWIKEMQASAALKQKTVRKYYFYYPFCPKCAQAYGHNYTVGFAQV